MVTSGGLEPPAYGLGNRRSILLSYEVTRGTFAPSDRTIPDRIGLSPLFGTFGTAWKRDRFLL
jgi:hypothetical protein